MSQTTNDLQISKHLKEQNEPQFIQFKRKMQNAKFSGNKSHYYELSFCK